MVHKDTQVTLLTDLYGVKNVLSYETGWEEFSPQMESISKTLKPTICLECVAGELTG